VKCPDSVYAVWIGMGVLLLAFSSFSYFLNRKKLNIAMLAIGVDYAQVLSMFAATKIQWPAYLLKIFDLLSAFNLNLDLTAPVSYFAVNYVSTLAATII
jgi:hypothetical protein